MTINRTLLAGTGLGILAAWLADLAILMIANIGAPVRVVTGWSPDGANLTAAEVLITSATAVASTGLGLWWWERHNPRAFRPWSIIVTALAALSAVPLWRLDVDAGSKVALTLMHLTTGSCAVLGQRPWFALRVAPQPGHRIAR